MHHDRVGEALNDRALGLLEALRLEAARRVRHELGRLGLHSDVVLHNAMLSANGCIQILGLQLGAESEV